MDRLAEVLSVLPAPMRDPVLFAIPFFLLLLTIEWTAARKLEHIDASTAGAPPVEAPTPATGAGAESGRPARGHI